jgi:SSS family solute:Na+ symporter
MVLAALVTPALKSLDQAYQFIQEYVGFFSPGVLAIFMLGLFWKRTSTAAALSAAIFTIPISTVLKFLPVWTNGSFPDLPFLNRMEITFVLVVLMMVIISLAKPKEDTSTFVAPEKEDFKVGTTFIVLSVIISGVIAALYTVYW